MPGTSAPEVGDGLGVIVRELARAVGAELALLAVAQEDGERVEVLAAWEAAARGGRAASALRADGLIARAIRFDRPAIEPVVRPAGQPDPGVAHILAAPVVPLSGRRGVLCAGLARDPTDEPGETLWLADGYARLAALCLHDRETLEGLASGGRIDGLTGCLTPSAFLRELEREVSRSARNERPLSCSFIDLDRFKRVNDRYGHLHGSRVLATVATTLRTEIRQGDTVGRYGGDEFVLILPDTDEGEALGLSQRLRATIARTTVNLPHDPIDASIGVAQWQPGASAQDLLGAADDALLAAKAAGGGSVVAAGGPVPAELRQGQIAGRRTARPLVEPHPVSMQDVIEVTAQFDEFGGASIELTAWELSTNVGHIALAWSHAIHERLIEPAATDEATGEEMWRITEAGRRAYDGRSR